MPTGNIKNIEGTEEEKVLKKAVKAEAVVSAAMFFKRS